MERGVEERGVVVEGGGEWGRLEEARWARWASLTCLSSVVVGY